MKNSSNSNYFYSKSRLLLGFLGVLLSGCVLLAGVGALSKTFAARIGSPQAGIERLFSAVHPTLVRHSRLDEQGNRLSGYVILAASIREAVAQSGRLELEIGLHLDHRAAMYLMLLLRRLILTSLSQASHPMAALVGHFIVQPTEATRGPRCCP